MLRSSITQRRLLAAPLTLGALLVASNAAATPMLSFATGQANPQKSPDPGRDTAHYPNGISYTDCLADEVFTFAVLAVSGTFQTGTDTLQIWAGTTDCAQYANRVGGGATPGTCQPVSAPVTVTASMQLTVRGRDLVNSALGKTSPSAGGGIVTNIAHSDVSICTAQTTAASIPISLVVVDFNNADPTGAMATGLAFNPGMGLGVVVDTVGPAAPSAPSIGVGDTLLKLSWTPVSDVTNTAGFTVFCDPPPGAAADAASYSLPDGSGPICVGASVADSGTVDALAVHTLSAEAGDATDDADAGTASTPDSATPSDASSAVDSGTSSSCGNNSDAGVCASNVIQPNVSGNVISSLGNRYYVCGNATGASSTELQINGLTNGLTYTFVVAATDLIGNTGPVTVFPCATPEPIADFWNKYKGDGGGAGGGFCALEAVGAPASSTVVGAGMLVAAIALARRRKR